MDSVLSFLFFMILGFYLLGIVGRLLLRMWVRRVQRQFEQGQGGGTYSKTYSWGRGGAAQRAETRPEGDVVIQAPATTEKKINKTVGDYVDYEEIKEDDK